MVDRGAQRESGSGAAGEANVRTIGHAQPREQQPIEYRAVKVSSVTGLSVAVSMGLQLIAVPICLRAWGQERYGAWLTVFAAYTIMRTLDGGYAGFVGNKLNILYHRDQGELRRVMASAVFGVAALGCLQLVVLAALYATNSLHLIVEARPGTHALSDVTLGVLVLSVSWICTGSYIGIVHRLLVPAGLMYQAAWWAMGYQVAQHATLVLAAVLGFSILHAACLVASVQAVVYLASAVWMRVRLPAYFPWWRDANARLGLTDIVRSVPVTISGILQQGSNGGVVLVVSSMLGPAIVPAFTTLRTLTNLWTTVVGVVTAPLFPDIVRFHATGAGKKLVDVHRAHALLVSSLVNASILAVYPFLGVVHGVWTRHRLPFDRSLMALLLAGTAISAMNSLMSVLLAGLNRGSFLISSAALRGGVATLFGIVLIPRIGIIGIGIAVLLGEGILVLITQRWFFRQELQRLGETGPVAPPGQMMGTAAVVAFLVASAWRTDLVGVAYPAAWIACVGSMWLGWRNLDPEIRHRISGLVLKILPFGVRAR